MAKAKEPKIRYRAGRGKWEIDARCIGMGRPLYDSEDEAVTEKARMILENDRLATVTDRDETLTSYVLRWEQRVVNDYPPATFRSYSENLRRHVLPLLGVDAVRKITRGLVKRFLDQKRSQGFSRGDEQRTYSKNALRLMNASLSVVLADALDDGLIDSNPCIRKGGRRKNGH
jgi:hypothetical protein